MLLFLKQKKTSQQHLHSNIASKKVPVCSSTKYDVDLPVCYGVPQWIFPKVNIYLPSLFQFLLHLSQQEYLGYKNNMNPSMCLAPKLGNQPWNYRRQY